MNSRSVASLILIAALAFAASAQAQLSMRDDLGRSLIMKAPGPGMALKPSGMGQPAAPAATPGAPPPAAPTSVPMPAAEAPPRRPSQYGM